MRASITASWRIAAIFLSAFVFVGASWALGPSIVGKWRLKPGKGGQGLAATVTFKSNRTGKMLMKQGDMTAEQHFKYRLVGNTLTLQAVKLVYKGKVQPTPKKNIVLKLKWRGKDRMQTQEIRDGKPFAQVDEMIRIK